MTEAQAIPQAVREPHRKRTARRAKYNPNILCPCGSGKKFKKCHGRGPVPQSVSRPVQVIPPQIKKMPWLPWRPYQERFLRDPCNHRIWIASAQVGKSTALAAYGLGKGVEKENELVVILSASERQAKEVALKTQNFVRAIANVPCSYTTEWFKDNSEILVHTIRLANGSRIIALSANPETARGYTGHIILDEFGHCPRDEEVFKVAFRQVTLGQDFLITSTPGGQVGKFYQMCHALGLDLGMLPAVQPIVKHGWSGHWTDIHLAVREGLPVNPEKIREGCDGDTWAQEYLIQFLSETTLWLSPDILEGCIDALANVGPPALHLSNLYCGWDIARKGHHSTLWFIQVLGDVSWCRGVVNITGQSTPIQVRQAKAWMPQIAAMNVDMTGMGIAIAEALIEEFPTKVLGVTFTAPIKEQMAVYMRMRMENKKLRIPNDDTVRRSFLSLRRSTNKIGQSRFDAESDEKYGHGDEFWSCALAEQAAERAVNAVARSQGKSSFMFDSQAKGPLSNFMNKPL